MCLCPLKVRDQAADVLDVAFIYQGRPAQVPLALGRFFGQDVAGKRFIATDFASSGLTEAFGGSTVCLDLGHLFFSLAYYKSATA